MTCVFEIGRKENRKVHTQKDLNKVCFDGQLMTLFWRQTKLPHAHWNRANKCTWKQHQGWERA